jgi:hypothetical protein
MTQYLMSVIHNPDDAEDPTNFTEDEMQASFASVGAFNERMQAAGVWVFAGGLHPIDLSTTVDNRGATPIVTDGPFSESKEYLGGFWIIEASDLDAALAWAADGSRACGCKVEVRAFQEI